VLVLIFCRFFEHEPRTRTTKTVFERPADREIEKMRVAVGADHAGFDLKQKLAADLRDLGHEVVDVGTTSSEPVDYPDFAEALGTVIRDKEVDRGVLICGSGVGASVSANKLPGVRAGLCHDTYSARQGVEHDDMNVLVLGARVIGVELARELVRVFLAATFSSDERHRRRVGKIYALEKRYGKSRKEQV
jgi:ribose 5-phosphate isomerase B